MMQLLYRYVKLQRLLARFEIWHSAVCEALYFFTRQAEAWGVDRRDF